MSKNMKPWIFIAAPPLKRRPNRMTALCESSPYDSRARHVDPLCISLQAPMQALTLALSCRHRFLSGRIGTIIAGSGFRCDTRSNAVRLGFAHLVDPQLADEHIHDLRAVDPSRTITFSVLLTTVELPVRAALRHNKESDRWS